MHLEKGVPLFFGCGSFLDFGNLKFGKVVTVPYKPLLFFLLLLLVGWLLLVAVGCCCKGRTLIYEVRVPRTNQNMKRACINHPCGRGNSTTSDA